MDCKLCERELEAYLQDRLPHEERFQIEAHLRECDSCSQSLFLEKLALEAILAEKAMLPASSLSDRIMEKIQEEHARETDGVIFMIPPVLRKIAYAASIAAALYIGIIAGNFYMADDSIPAEMSYINDLQIESVNLFTNEN